MLATPIKTYRVIIGKTQARQPATSARQAVLAAVSATLPSTNDKGQRLPAWRLEGFNGKTGTLRTAGRSRTVRVVRLKPKTTIGAPVRPQTIEAPMTTRACFGKLSAEVELARKAVSPRKRRAEKRARLAAQVAHLSGTAAAAQKPVDRRAKLLAQIKRLRSENARLRAEAAS